MKGIAREAARKLRRGIRRAVPDFLAGVLLPVFAVFFLALFKFRIAAPYGQ
jgi:hypothetical protein